VNENCRVLNEYIFIYRVYFVWWLALHYTYNEYFKEIYKNVITNRGCCSCLQCFGEGSVV